MTFLSSGNSQVELDDEEEELDTQVRGKGIALKVYSTKVVPKEMKVEGPPSKDHGEKDQE